MKTLLIVAIFFIGIYAVYKSYSVGSVDKKLDEHLRCYPIILDVRTSSEYEGGHIEGSVNIPLS